MKIVLVNPYFQLIGAFQGYMEKIGSVLPPLGLAMLGSTLRNKGHQVIIIDGWIENQSLKKFINTILQFQPDIVGLYTNTSSFFYAREIIRFLREKNEALVIIAGGPHTSVIPIKTLHDCPGLDYCVIGEGEYIITELCAFLERNSFCRKIDSHDDKVKSIKGIAYRTDKGTIVMNDKSDPISNIDELPFPAWDLLKMNKYKPSTANYLHLPSYTLITSRGCPFNCSFCSKPLGKRVHFHSAKRVFDEIKLLHDDYGAKEIIFEDDCFTLNKRRLLEIFSLLRSDRLNISWSCLTRVDTVDSNLLQAMKRANCWRVGYGVESGNEKILSKMQKGFSKQRLIDVFKFTKSLHIGIRAFFILGNLYDTHESIQETINFAKYLNPDIAQFSYFVPFPGTPDYDYAVNQKLIDPDYYLKAPLSDYHNLKKLIFVPPGLTEMQIKNYQKKALRSFYFRPKYVINQLRDINNLEILSRKLKIAIDLTKDVLL